MTPSTGLKVDGMGDRRVVGHAAIHQHALRPAHGGQHGRDRRAGHHGIGDWAGGQAELLAGDDVDGDDVQRYRQLLEVLALEMRAECETCHAATPANGRAFVC